MENKKQKIDVIKLELPVTGMSCAGCAVGVEKKVAGSSGVKSAAVNFANKSIMVEFDPSVTDTAKLKQSVQEAGYDLIIEEYGLTEEASEEREQKYYRSLRHNTIMSWLFALPVMVISMFFMEHRALQYVVFLLTIPVVAIFGRDFFIKGFKGIGKGGVGMDTLVALSTSIAFIFSTFNLIFPHFWGSRGLEADLYFEAATMIIAFVLLGRLLEEKAKGNTTSAIKKLMALQPKEATLVDESGAGKVVPISSLVPGNIVRVKPGEQIAVDGSVVSGNSYVDESTITGESVAVLKVNGEKLFAGTINQKGSLDFKVEKVGGDTLLGQIVKAVKDAQGSKAPVQKIVDKVAAIFVPTVIVIAIITLSVWLIFGGKAMVSHALLATVSVLVIACPCALGLATPTAIMVGMGKGAREHILIKDATALEQMKRVDTVVLDKTGTITKGEPTVSDWIWLDTVEEERRDWLNKIIYSIEALSEHPLAEAIIAHIALAGKGERVEVSNFKSITGVGVEAQFEGERYYLG
ncbi:MAG: heavy metal translocating P-type ATPase, partial [Bacteroidales bacterium]